MRLKKVGALAGEELLAHDWYKVLNKDQLLAYVRYQFLSTYFRQYEFDSRAHSARYKRWDGGRSADGVRHKSVWAEIADEILKHEAVPGLWVHAHFSASFLSLLRETRKGFTSVQPSMLKGPISFDAYRDYLSACPLSIRQAYHIAHNSIMTRYAATTAYELPPDDHYFYVLCDTAYVNASSFFRYVFGALENCRRVESRYIFEAAIDYESHQIMYDRVIDDGIVENVAWWRPDELMQEVISIRQKWSEYCG
jgi:hypothetical protein